MASGGPTNVDVFEVRKVRRLVELMNEHDLAEIDLRQGNQRIRLRRGQDPAMVVAAPVVASATAVTVTVAVSVSMASSSSSMVRSTVYAPAG